jgi:hypothetical protein
VTLEDIINEINFAGLLVGSGVELKDGRDTDRIVLGPKERAHDLLGRIVPATEGSTIRVCVRKEDDLEITKGQKLVNLDFMHAACSQPDVLGIKLRENHGRLLGLNNTNHGTMFEHGLHG